MPVPPPLPHFTILAEAASRGRLAVFLGAGINMAQRPQETRWVRGSNFLPSGWELSKHLAKISKYPLPRSLASLLNPGCPLPPVARKPGMPDPSCAFQQKAIEALVDMTSSDLAKVSQHAQTNAPQINLQLELHSIFDHYPLENPDPTQRAYPSTPLHDALAKLCLKPTINRKPIFITTNYDTVMETALAAENIPFDVLYYRASPLDPAWLYHWKNAHDYYKQRLLVANPLAGLPDSPVPRLELYDELPLGSDKNLTADIDPGELARTLVVKIHGTVAPSGMEDSSFVISEDDYIRFLRDVSTQSPFPKTLVDRLLTVHFLFVGYGFGDWNILAICQNLWSKRKSSHLYNWAIQPDPPEEDCLRWQNATGGSPARIQLYDCDATSYANQLPP